ncbi:MAG: TIGR03960 family B12-binding radical SAM protein [Firmicutes bacterium]|nr:TIGR03960 family B12-binding radical SAM protein [Bacillota bacterium]
MNQQRLLDEILPRVTKPGRYIGGEWNAVRKDWNNTPVKFALAFPDIYDIGMGHLGYKILYYILNQREDTLAERVYAPWTDMEARMRECELPLFSLETRHGLADFDLVGFTLQYELSYTGILNMLDLGGIPVLAAERSLRDPFVVGGGPGVFNPEPLAAFFDLFVIGDGEEAIHDLVDLYLNWKRNGSSRETLLLQAAAIPGVYVPRFYQVKYDETGVIQTVTPTRSGIPPRVQKRVVQDLDSAIYPMSLVVPYIEVVHDRIMLEVMRGCTRGCRFCQAGMIYRPVRERRRETLLKHAEALVKSTGYEEISLASLSTSDYGDIQGLIQGLLAKYGDCGVALSLPSLRLDSFSVDLADEIQTQRRTGLTFAPEAGTQRLRDVINKNVTEEDLLSAATAAFKAGWDSLKLYFMIGLPTETLADVAGIAQLTRNVLRLGREIRGLERKAGRVKISVSVGCFVPKSYTPFQWVAQAAIEELEEKQRYLRGLLSDRAISFSWTDAEKSLLEAVIARGDRRLGKVLYRAWQAGSRLDGWSEHFSFSLWQEAFAAENLDPYFYSHRERNKGEVLPWDHIDAGVSKQYLLEEWAKALAGEVTQDCRYDGCSGCGLCPTFGVKNLLVGGGHPSEA